MPVWAAGVARLKSPDGGVSDRRHRATFAGVPTGNLECILPLVNAPSIAAAVRSRSCVIHPVAGTLSAWKSRHQFRPE